ncbi:murein transglycosylase domain-containing protein [Candidatus Nardonella dryophthoridicola]|uniref:murein transglycosylase domain-containing protein n=1 Tax=Candidatus Nardonella dryophthoridicola TaxID=1971485 RepID=UPI001AD86EF8|nr:murein transglycosylase domain-containing protein [Candidatus Nardonella dryophthoridicola]QTJ62888.1 DUF3393 domain-containing protein [Candidatus Nardonella dryophthoridicola]
MNFLFYIFILILFFFNEKTYVNNKKISKKIFFNNINNKYNFDFFCNKKNILSNIYFKYSNNYNTLTIIDFNNKNIIIKTFNNNYLYKELLIIEILNILNIYNFNIFTYNDIKKKYYCNHKLNFYNNLKNKNNNYIYIDNYLVDFAKFIVNFKLKIKLINNIKLFYIKISFKFIEIYNIIKNYINILIKYSKIYNIDIILVLSIIKVESNFNKYAVSNSGAIGIMQIIYNKAGLDVYNNINNFYKYPHKNMLFNVFYNIKMGICYLSIIQNKYLSDIKNKDSLRYLTIASYNGGVNNILRIFNKNFKKSITIINSMDSKLVYKSIVNHHPSKEIRNYLKVVNNLYLKYYKYKNIYVFINNIKK